MVGLYEGLDDGNNAALSYIQVHAQYISHLVTEACLIVVIGSSRGACNQIAI